MQTGSAGGDPNALATAFFRQLIELAAEVAPGLRMGDPDRKRTAGGYLEINHERRPTLKSYMHIKQDTGRVDLQVSNWGAHLEQVQGALQPTLDPGMLIAEAGASVAFRIKVRPFDPTGSFEAQREEVREALAAAVRLDTWYQRNLGTLDDLGQRFGSGV